MKFEKKLFPEMDLTRPILIAGPCSAETEDQVMTTARRLSDMGIKLFRAGIWKPRTRPGAFEGVGVTGLPWLQRVKAETGMRIVTEVASPFHIQEALKHDVDMLWIGARTTVNPFLMQELAEALRGVDIPVLVKNPVNPDVDLWVGAMERLYNAGITRMGVIHRGFSSSDKRVYRNLPQWNIAIEIRRRFPDLLMICDPSHIGGKRELISPLSQQAMDLNFDGLMIESHCSPDKAWSDAAQQVTPESLSLILKMLVIRQGGSSTEQLSEYRAQIDELDDRLVDLLSKRLEICRQIGVYKKENNMQVLQAVRYNEIMESRLRLAEHLGIGVDCMEKIWASIHEESVRQQMKIVNE